MTSLFACADRSERPRRACVVNYIADGVYSDTNEPLLNGVPVIEKVSEPCMHACTQLVHMHVAAILYQLNIVYIINLYNNTYTLSLVSSQPNDNICILCSSCNYFIDVHFLLLCLG